jgi:predicted ATPase
VLTAKDGFFLRAESLYNLASNIDNLNEDDGELIQYYGGKSLHEQSHGEAFISLMMNRFSSKGLYILDEPEAALSPTRQMALITRINDLVKRDSQFIIATHSPIIMSYTNADIFDIENGYKIVDYKETEHYAVTREFLNNTDKMLEILLEE